MYPLMLTACGLLMLAAGGLRQGADDVGFPVQHAYAEALDRFLFAGILPTAWLQDHVRFGWLDQAAKVIHLTHFAIMFPVGALAVRAGVAQRFLSTFVMMWLIALSVHVVLPTAPPWLASDVVRVIAETSTFQDLDGNLVAAMPSLHVGFATLAALVLAQFGKLWGVVGATYDAAMCFSLTYLGEHYVVDELAGIALAVGAWRVVQSGVPQPISLRVLRPSGTA